MTKDASAGSKNIDIFLRLRPTPRPSEHAEIDDAENTVCMHHTKAHIASRRGLVIDAQFHVLECVCIPVDHIAECSLFSHVACIIALALVCCECAQGPLARVRE